MSETESKPRETKPRFSKADRQESLCRVISRKRSAVAAFGCEMPQLFHVVEPTPGAREILWQSDPGGLCQYVPDEAVLTAVLRFCHRETDSPMLRGVDEAQARAAVRFWKYFRSPIKEPLMIRQLSDPGLCFHRLPFDVTAIQTPVFDEFLNRCTNGNALCGFIGSLMEPRADRQQYVYLHGDGLNGKGALLRFLARVMGPAYAAKVPPGRDDRFWTYGLLGKRLVAFPDCSERHFPGSPLFKMLTGGDRVPVEQKGHQGYTAELGCKFIFASNDEPQLSGQESDRRRAIYCEVAKINGQPDPHYDDRLWAEAAGILYRCRAEYSRLTADHGPITVDTDGFDGLVQKNGGDFEEIFEDCFSLDDGRKEEDGSEKPDNKKLHFTPGELAAVLLKKRRQGDFKHAFVKWLWYTHGIRFKQVKLDNGPRRVYVGACVKSSHASSKTKFDAHHRYENVIDYVPKR